MSLTDTSELTLKPSNSDMANAIRILTVDAVEAAKSGHPGMPMGMADVATVLFTKFLRYDAENPDWPDRDRFVLGAGHGSMLLYALLYLTGNPDITIGQIKNFRQLGSLTAGHPESNLVPAIETTTGPLGQGIANAVGMAIAERHLAARFGTDIVDHRTFVIAGDGDLMEGISHEAASLAGHLKLEKLVILFDDNGISIDGPTRITVNDNQILRFQSYGWDTQEIDGHDPAEIERALKQATNSNTPSLIACRTKIGFGSPNKQGTASTHGAPLGEKEVAETRKRLNWTSDPFEIPLHILTAWRNAGMNGGKIREGWNLRLKSHPQGKEFTRIIAGKLPKDWQDGLMAFKRKITDERPNWASRRSSQEALEIVNVAVPETLGGSADLTGSNNTKTKALEVFSKENYSGRYIHYGVREHAMAAVMNGMALHGGVIPYGGTFLVFSDYLRPAMRLSALMGTRVIYVLSHDSIGLGEDGPTHQPIEHLASLRAIPNLLVFRPADAVETIECWVLALEHIEGPSVIALSRQNLKALRKVHTEKNRVASGAYEISSASGSAKVTIMATGSEVAIAIDAQQTLQNYGIPTRVVSVPCRELLDNLPADQKKAVIRPDTVRVAVEAAIMQGWEPYVGDEGIIIGMESFGASAPAGDLFAYFSITADAIVEAVRLKIG